MGDCQTYSRIDSPAGLVLLYHNDTPGGANIPFHKGAEMMQNFTVRTGGRSDFIDITQKVRAILGESGIDEGICHVFISHTTAGVTINENADPDVRSDMIAALDKLVPWSDGYRHMEGNSAAHIKASMMGFSVEVPVSKGRLVLGTWQCIYFCEFDGPRTRTVHVSCMGA